MNFTKQFLRAKHWQLFLLLFGIPMLFYTIIMVNMFSTLIHASKPDPSIVFEQFKFFPVIMIFFMAGLFGWLWSVAIGFQQQIPENIKMKINRFRIFFFIPQIYIVTNFIWHQHLIKQSSRFHGEEQSTQ